MSTSAYGPAGTLVLADAIPGDRLRDIGLSLGFTVAIALSAQIAIPLGFTPVPVTLQTFVVLLGAIGLGATRSTAGAALYLVLGTTGLPLFASGGATYGYIVGFVVAAFALGSIAARGRARSATSVAAAMVAGNMIIYAFGIAGLVAATPMNVPQAVSAGTTPFIIGDVLKIAAAVVLVPTLWRAVGDPAPSCSDHPRC